MALARLHVLHHQAMTLRLSGMTYAEIAEQVDRSPNTVRNWFHDEPLFMDAYAALSAEAVERARTIVLNAAPDAARNLVALMLSEHQPTALGAVRDILDRSGLKPSDKVTHEGKVAIDIDDARDRLAARLAALADREPAQRGPGIPD